MPLLNFKQSGQGLDLILIHGLFGSMDNLNMVSRVLSKSYRVTNIDVRNHGDSFQINNMEYTELAQDVVKLMDHLNIVNAAILGHSMGGKIAMQIALDHGHRVTKLMVADIAPVTYPAHHLHIIEGLNAIDLSKVKNRKDADQQLSKYVDDAGVRQFLLRNLIKNTKGDYYFKCALKYISNCYPQIMLGYQGDNNYQGDTLFIKGGNSDYIKAEHREIIIQLFPHSQAKIINGTGHWLHAEKSVVFNKIVSDFLAS